MRRISKSFAVLGLGVAALAVALMVPGCSNTPLAPTVGDNSRDAIQYGDAQLQDPAAMAKLLGSLLSDTDSVLVGGDGGAINLSLGGARSSLHVPNGALNASVSITALAWQFPTPWGTVTLYDFGPNGLAFTKAATLTLSTNLAKGTVLTLYWYNPSTGQWEVQAQSTVKNDGSVEFPIWHFSKYGIS